MRRSFFGCLITVCVPFLLATMTGSVAESAESQDVVFVSKLDGTEQRYVVILPD